MTTTRVFKSTDASAPTLTGTSGSLIAVLDACLVNGYGAKAACGWAKSFLGANKAAYRAPVGNRFYLKVTDDGSIATYAQKAAALRGYVSMTDVDTGTEDFPTVAQDANGVYVGKSSTLDSTARPWVVIADEKRVIILTAYNASTPNAYQNSGFGDLIGGSASDAFATVIWGATSAALALGSSPASAANQGNIVYSSFAITGLYAARNGSGALGAAAQTAGFICGNTSGSGNSQLPVGPNAVGDVWGDPVQICDGTSNAAAPRGRFPGLLFLRNYLDEVTYPTFYAFGAKQVIRYASAGSKAYMVDTGNWE